MPYEFHGNPETYLNLLIRNSEKSILPFLEQHLPNGKSLSNCQILELGCGEGGNLKPFAAAGARCTGIDLNKAKIEQGKVLMKSFIDSGHLELYHDDIYNPEIESRFTNRFDIVILKDVIEHIPDKKKAMLQMKQYLKDDGLLFIGWPPWAMPFGGHQQICHSKLLKTFPWLHLLPKPLYVGVLKAMGEPKEVYDELAEVYDFRVPFAMMNRLVLECQLTLKARKDYFINPIYEYKFGFKTREQSRLIMAIPGLRDLVTTSSYYLLSKS